MTTCVDDHLYEDPIKLFMLEDKHVSERYLSWMNNPEIQQHLESRFAEHSRESLREFVRKCSQDADTLFFGIANKENSRHVGNIKVGPINRRHLIADIGLRIGDKSVWGCGFATAAIRCVVRIMQKELNLAKATAGAYESNIGSIRAFEKAGFTIESVRPAHCLVNGVRESLVSMGLIF